MPRQIKLDKDERRELGQRIADGWENDNLDRELWLADLPRWIRAYQGKVEQKNTPWDGASNLHVPVTATVVDAIHPREMAAVFRPKPIVNFKPQEPGDREKARRRERFLDWATREDVNIFPVMDRTLLAKEINGLQFLKITWELKIRHLRDRHEFPKDWPLDQVFAKLMDTDIQLIEAITRVEDSTAVDAIIKDRGKVTIDVEDSPRKMIVYTEREEIVRDAPRIDLIDAEDVVVNSDAGFDLQEADHLTHRYWLTLDKIKREVQKGTFVATSAELDDIEKILRTDIQPSAGDNTIDVKQAREDVTGAGTTFRLGDPERVELIDAYMPYDVNDDGYDEDILVTIVKERPSIVLRVVRLEDVYRHGMRPFVAFHMFPVAGSFWSIGVPQILDGLQQEINTIHNQRVDAGTISNTPWGWYVPSAGFNPERIPVEPGFMTPVDDINAVKMHQPANYTAWGFQEERLLWDLVERRTKVSDLTLGRVGDTQGAARTATGVQALSNQQATGFDIFIRRTQESFRQLLHQLLGLYAQYMPPGKELRVLGNLSDPDIVVTREDLVEEMDMEFTGNALSTDREVERNTSTLFAQTVFNPQVQTFLGQIGVISPQGVAEWYRHLFTVFDVPNRDRIIKMPEAPVLVPPDEVVSRLLGGERLIPKPGENHGEVMQKIQALLQKPDSAYLPTETRMLLEEQMSVRQAAQQQEAYMAMMAQAQQMQQQAQQPPMSGPPPGPPGGAPQPGPPGPPMTPPTAPPMAPGLRYGPGPPHA